MNETPTARQLLRSTDDRVIAGVSGGLARYFGVDPVIFRIGFAVAAFVGGIGLLAYLAAWLFVPEDDGSGSPRPIEWTGGRVAAVAGIGVIALIVLGSGPLWFMWDEPQSWAFLPLAVIAVAVFVIAARRLRHSGERRPFTARRVIGLVAIGVAAAVVLGVLAVGGAWAAAEGYGEVVAVTVLSLGVTMVLAAFAPRVRRGAGVAWLALPALALAIPAGAVAASDFELHGGYGERYWHPATVAEIPADGYEHAAGEAVVDLRGLEWRRNQVVDLEVEQGFGELRVLTPSDVCVELDAHADAGAVWFRGDESGGVDYDREEHPVPSSAPRLRLDADITGGEIIVADHDVATDSDHWHDFDEEQDHDALLRAQQACEDR